MGNPFGGANGKLQLRGLASFPALARQAEPAQSDPSQGLHTSRSDRRIANVAWLTVTDAVYRLPRMTGASGKGLRGGTYTVTNTATGTQIDYQKAQFTQDVYVSGQVTLDATNALTGQVTLTGPHGRTGTLSHSRNPVGPGPPASVATRHRRRQDHRRTYPDPMIRLPVHTSMHHRRHTTVGAGGRDRARVRKTGAFRHRQCMHVG